LTLLGQSLGSMILGIEAFEKFCPEIYIGDFFFAYIITKLFKSVIGRKIQNSI